MAEREEVEKALLELQERYATNLSVLQRVAQQERTTLISKQKLELVLAELQALPDTTPTYKLIGRAYFLDTRSNILEEGSLTVKEATTEIETLKQKRSTLEEKLADTRRELNEMVKA